MLTVVIAACILMASAASSSPLLSVSPTKLQTSGQSVTISWDIPPESFTDRTQIGVYVPADAADQSFLGTLPVDEPQGSATVALLNFREPQGYQFRVFAKGIGSSANTTAPIAVSMPVTFENTMTELLHPHLGAGSEAGSYTLMFTTGIKCEPTMRFWSAASPTETFSQATGTSATYTQTDLCGSPANSSLLADGQIGWRDPGMLHTIAFTVNPDWKKVNYAFECGSQKSAQLAFLARPLPGADARLFTFGDLGINSPFGSLQEQFVPAQQTVKWVTERALQAFDEDQPWAVLHIGDISYARGYAWQWEYFMSQWQTVWTKFPYQVSMGNHEFDWPSVNTWKPAESDPFHDDSGGECGVPFDSRFAMPGPDGAQNRWFRFDYGTIRFIVFNSEQDFTPGSAQHEWMVAELQQANTAQQRLVTPWLVVAAHRPMYSDSSEKSSGFEEFRRKTLEPLFIQQQVDLCLWGHVHKYLRTCPVKDYECQPDGTAPVHWLIGMAGNTFQTNWAKGNRPDWAMFRTENFGFTTLFANKTHMHGEFFGDQEGQLHDEMWLVKQ